MSHFDINDIILQDAYESNEKFLLRKKITLKLATLDQYPLNPMSAVVITRCIINKVELGVTYEPQVEELIEKLLTYL